MRDSTLPVYINGRFLSQATTGVQRYATEVVTALDKLLGETNSLNGKGGFQLLVPPNTRRQLPLYHIYTRCVGSLEGHLWEQLELPTASSDGMLIGLGNTGPLRHQQQIVTVHDASVFANPGNFSVAFRTWYRLLLPRLGRRARKILTVSEFSKRELMRYCSIPEDKIEVAYNGVDHIIREPADPDVFSSRGIHPGSYLLCVATSSPNKNVGLVCEALQLLGDSDLNLVTVGAANPRIFAKLRINPNLRVHNFGYASDRELRALYENALCFVFPSLYEGFGIPPLEAMLCSCPVIVARTSALPESCGDAALYCHPHDAAGLALQIKRIKNDRALRRCLQTAGKAHATKFTWKTCAEHVLGVVSGCSRS